MGIYVQLHVSFDLLDSERWEAAWLTSLQLLEDTFPRHVLVCGDINRVQAEQVAAWAESILGRSLALPVVTDAPRLWSRLGAAYAEQPDLAIGRFLRLLSDGREAPWTLLSKL